MKNYIDSEAKFLTASQTHIDTANNEIIGDSGSVNSSHLENSDSHPPTTLGRALHYDVRVTGAPQHSAR